jgi:hypothetical protein
MNYSVNPIERGSKLVMDPEICSKYFNVAVGFFDSIGFAIMVAQKPLCSRVIYARTTTPTESLRE